MTNLKAGDTAPPFTGIDQNGNEVNLSDFLGKKVILYFYPKDNTPTCTVEACNFRDNHTMLKEKGFVVLGVSPDSERKHRNFIDKFELPFTLLADTDHSIIKAYDVWGPKKFMGKEYEGLLRTTFVIDENGKIERVFVKVKSKEHTQQILDSYATIEI
ncbi:MAG: thioredoxin-dependent thiol peroxidase [Bacteroidota bacterium]